MFVFLLLLLFFCVYYCNVMSVWSGHDVSFFVLCVSWFLLFVLLLWAASIVEPMAFLVACHIWQINMLAIWSKKNHLLYLYWSPAIFRRSPMLCWWRRRWSSRVVPARWLWNIRWMHRTQRRDRWPSIRRSPSWKIPPEIDPVPSSASLSSASWGFRARCAPAPTRGRSRTTPTTAGPPACSAGTWKGYRRVGDAPGGNTIECTRTILRQIDIHVRRTYRPQKQTCDNFTQTQGSVLRGDAQPPIVD